MKKIILAAAVVLLLSGCSATQQANFTHTMSNLIVDRKETRVDVRNPICWISCPNFAIVTVNNDAAFSREVDVKIFDVLYDPPLFVAQTTVIAPAKGSITVEVNPFPGYKVPCARCGITRLKWTWKIHVSDEERYSKNNEQARLKREQALRDALRRDALLAAGQAGGDGRNDGYGAQVRACVQPGVAFPTPPRSGATNPAAVYRVQLRPDGTIADVKLTRGSGNPNFDRAVETGIRRCSPFPKPPSGSYPGYIGVNYNMYN